MTTSSAAAARKFADALQEASQVQERFSQKDTPKTAEQADDEKAPKDKFAKIKSNPFYKIIFDPALSEKEQEALIHKTAKYDPALSARENEAKKDAVLELHAYLQSKATALSEEQLAKMEVEGFGETRGVYEELGRRLIEFTAQMGEYGELQNALERLRNDDKALDVLSEIFDDQERKDQLLAEKAALEQEAEAARAAHAEELRQIDQRRKELEDSKRRMREENAAHEQNKGFFGGIKKESKTALAVNEERLQQADVELTQLQMKLGSVSQQVTQTEQSFADKLAEANAKLSAPVETKFAEYQKEKELMQGLFDISTDEHKEKITKLRDTALEFVKFSKNRLGTAVDNMEKVKADLRTQGEFSDFLNDKYMVIAKGISAANKDNVSFAKTLENPVVDPEHPEDGEDPLATLERERTRASVNNYNGAMLSVSKSIVTQISKINTQKGAIEGAKKLNDQQIEQTNDLATSAVADTAIRLTTTFASLNNATAGEAAQTAEYLLNKMDADNRNSISRMFTSAERGLEKRNRQVLERIESVTSLASVMNDFKDGASGKISDLLGSMDELTARIDEGRKALNDAAAVETDVQAAHVTGERVTSTPAARESVQKAKAPDKDDPFAKFTMQ